MANNIKPFSFLTYINKLLIISGLITIVLISGCASPRSPITTINNYNNITENLTIESDSFYSSNYSNLTNLSLDYVNNNTIINNNESSNKSNEENIWCAGGVKCEVRYGRK